MTLSLPPLLAWLAATVLPLGAAWLLFRVALRPERCFGYNRILLLLAPLVAAGLPLLTRPALPVWLAPPALKPAETVGGSVLLPALSAAGGVGNGAWPGWPWLLALYGAGVALGLGRLAWQLWQLRQAARGLPREERAGYVLRYTGGRLPTSSFGHTIFWDETASLTAAEAASMLAHERAHGRQNHTYDVLWLEVWRALLWPNPFSHLLLPALRLTHELLADRAAATAAAVPTPSAPANASSYAALLAQRAARGVVGPAYPALLQPFTFSFTLTRIVMLQNQIPVRRWKQWLALPVLAGLLVVAGRPASAQSLPGKRDAAWQEKLMRNAKEAFRQDSLATGGKRTPGQTWHLEIKDDATVELTYETSPPPPPKLLSSAPNTPKVVAVAGGHSKSTSAPDLHQITEMVEQLAQNDIEPGKPNDPNQPKVYTYVEQMPELPGGGGSAAIIQAFQKNLVYPIANRGAEGRVFVSFTVDAEGAVRDPKIIKGLSSDYDAAVLAAVQKLPRFVPGRQDGKPVAVSFTVPVQFAK